jgi:Domain of unknown function (DUF4431)
MPFLIVALLMALSADSAVAEPQPCLQFEPAVTTIVGKLIRKTLAGPPNYESIKAGDAPETYWFVAPARPLCVRGIPGDDRNRADVANVSTVQLILLHDEYKTHTRLMGHSVKATGTLSTAITGHHHTPVVLEVTKLEPSR